jgi:hypothetical protein
MHNFILKSASTTSILKPFEKKFLKNDFLLKHHQNPQVLKRRSMKKRKLQESLQIKGEVNILRGEKRFNFKTLFDVIPFSPPPSYHFKNPFQNN